MLKKQLLKKANQENLISPLSFGQQSLFFLYLNSPESFSYNVAFNMRIKSEIDIPALKKSFQILLNRYESLRTIYYVKDGKPVQEILGYQEISFEEINADGFNDEDLSAITRKIYEIPFDLGKGPVIRIYLFRISELDNLLMIKMHHICNDGWSIALMLNDLKQIYEYETDNVKADLPVIDKQYTDYIKYQNELVNSDEGAKLWSYWKNELSGELPLLNLPANKPRPAVQTFNGKTEYFTIDNDLVIRIKELSKKEGVTLFVMLQTIYQIFLHRYTGQNEIIVGSPTAGRNQTEFENIVGYFINPVAVKGTFSENISFSEFLQQIKKKVIGAISNQDFPFSIIVDRLLHRRDPSRTPVFQTFFGLQKVQKNDDIQEMLVPGNKGNQIQWGKFLIESFELPQQEGQFDLTAEFIEGQNSFDGAFKFNTDLFDDEMMKQMVSHFQILLNDIVSFPETKISEFKLLPEKEKDLITVKWNDTDFVFDDFDCVHNLISDQTKKTPKSIAVVYGNERITYEELNQRSNRLARFLIKNGVTKDSLTGLCIERSVEMVVGILGILKAGSAYVPIDPSYPKSRVEFMIKDSGAKYILTQKNLSSILPKGDYVFVEIDKDINNFSNESREDIEIKTNLDDTAYVIYTSGSTGLPKGVMISHRSLSNHMLWMTNEFRPNESDSVLQKTPFSFDASVWEFYLPLITGGRLIMAKPEGQMDTAYLVETIIKEKVTILQLVPSLLRMLLNENGIENCKSLKKVFCGGEALTNDLKNKLFEKLNVEFYNLYGPTEATIDATFYKCEKDSDDNYISIGKPVYNTQIYILDKYLNPVPAGIPGELFIGGVDVAKGYLNNPELTESKFIPDIFSKKPGAKLYKTGDAGKFRTDGNIEFLGRVDNQVKLRGFRIELGEIESKLNQYFTVGESVVIVREDKPGNQRLAAYIVSRNNSEIITIDIKQFLRDSLPEYMIPSVFVILDKLPLTPNGKVDRLSLPVPEISKTESDTYVAPRLPVEEILADIWIKVLGIEKIGVHDNFFELGGDSIISIQIISQANQAGIKITPKQIFQFQTIAELSNVAVYSAPAINQQDEVSGNVNLTPVQKWFFEQNIPDPHHYNHSVLLKVPAGLNEKFLEDSVKEIVRHHDALRLRFDLSGKEWHQINADSEQENIFSTLKIDLSENCNDKNILEENINSLQESLNLSHGPLIRIRLYKTGNAQDRLLIIIHHLCVDGISWRVILEDFYNCYADLSLNREFKLPTKTTSFKDWSSKLTEYSDSEKIAAEKEYWKSVSDAKVQKIPEDFSSGTNQNTVESSSEEILIFDEQITEALLHEIPKVYNTKINDLLLTALIIAYKSWTNETRLLINLEGHGREYLFEKADVSRTVGWFTTIFPVLLDSGVSNNIGDIIKKVKEDLRKIPENGIGYGILRYLSSGKQISGINDDTGKPGIIFNYLGQMSDTVSKDSEWKIGSRSIILSRNVTGVRTHSIEINSIITNNKLKMNFTFSRNIHKKETIETFAGFYRSALLSVIDHCKNPEAGGYTVSDFSESGLDQQELDNLLANLN